MIRKRKSLEPPGSSKNLSTITLPKPALDRGMPVLQALRKRKTTREIGNKKLSLQVLSNLLWAACGINRQKVQIGISGRTAASASNSQEIDVYVAMKDGVYLYDPSRHSLVQVAAGDLRGLALGQGQPDSGADAPVRLIYVADIDRLVNTSGFPEPGLQDPDIQKSYYYVDTGLIAGNVYLFAASQGLATWFHNCNKPALLSQLNFRPDQRILFGQTVGYAKRK